MWALVIRWWWCRDYVPPGSPLDVSLIFTHKLETFKKFLSAVSGNNQHKKLANFQKKPSKKLILLLDSKFGIYLINHFKQEMRLTKFINQTYGITFEIKQKESFVYFLTANCLQMFRKKICHVKNINHFNLNIIY